ncbi:MAG: ATP-binding protein [Pseudomonadota bacterium]
MFREFAVSKSGLAAAIEHVRQSCDQLGLSGDVANPLCVILDEMVGNMMMHGQLGEGSVFALSIGRSGPSGELVLRDRGPSFDPVHWPPDDREGPGGRGLLIARSLADRMDYDRVGEENRLTVTVAAKPRAVEG